MLATVFQSLCTMEVDDGIQLNAAPVRVGIIRKEARYGGVRVYPKATVVAEKLHAICILGLTNSRMKDFYDLDLLLQDHELDDAETRLAVAATFQRRQSPLPVALPIGLSDAFAADSGKRAQWAAFLRKNRLGMTELQSVVRRIRDRSARIGVPVAA